MTSLAVKYRPKTLDEIIGQKTIIKAIKKILERKSLPKTWLFTGPSGVGKTTTARILANHFAGGKAGLANIIPIDAATETGAEEMRAATGRAYNKALGESVVKTHIVDECFPGDVEILTERGFIRFDLLEKEIKVAQVTAGGFIQWVLPTNYIEKHYEGSLCRLHSEKLLDLSMTPNHEVLFSKGSPLLEKTKAVSLVCDRNIVMPVASWQSHQVIQLTPFERLMIAAQADANLVYKLRSFTLDFHFSKERKITRLIEICQAGGFLLTEIKGYGNKRRFLVKKLSLASKRLTDHFDITNLSTDKAAAIIEEMVHWMDT